MRDLHGPALVGPVSVGAPDPSANQLIRIFLSNSRRAFST